MTDATKLLYKPDIDFEKELFEAAVNLRGTVAPANLSMGAEVLGCRGE